MEDIVFIAGQRTPFGAFGGTFKDPHFDATQLGLSAAKATLEQVNFPASKVEHLIFGNVSGATSNGPYLPRHIGLRLGVPQDRGAFLVNRLCGSGFQSWVSAAQMMKLGEAQCILAGGAENMSQIPYILPQARFHGQRLGDSRLVDLLSATLHDEYAQAPMAITAENLAEKYKITREQADEYSHQSQQRYKQAKDKGLFDEEISAVSHETKKGPLLIDEDEHPKPGASLEKMNQLPALFKKQGTVTAGTASGIVDGAAASLLTTKKFALDNKLQPLARIKGWSSVGCDPKIMGIGPVAAIQQLLKQTNLQLKDIDLIEVNEAFAAQYLAVEKELKLDPKRTNVNGGSIAVGHPLGATGTRIMNHLVYELGRRQAQYAIGSACIGGGQGIAVLIERIS